jgi:hypothetical protein
MREKVLFFGQGLLPVLFVSEAKLFFDFGNLFEFVKEFLHAEVGDDKFSEFKGWREALPADFDHAVHRGTVGVDVANRQFDSMLRKERHGFAAPGAAPFDVKGGDLTVLFHLKCFRFCWFDGFVIYHDCVTIDSASPQENQA